MRRCLAVSLRDLVLATVLASLLMLFVGCSGEPSSPVVFPDPKLEAAIREAIGKPSGNIKKSDLDDLTEFGPTQKGIVNLTGLEHCTKLELLGLSSNRISDLSPLSSVTSLRTVFLDNNRISDLSPLSSLSKLTQLNIEWNEISDLSPLSSLSNLQYLRLEGNRISDLSPLSGLTNLENLYLSSNQIRDISPLSGLARLWWLELGINHISDLSPLSGLTGLEDLGLAYNQIADIGPLVSNPGIAPGDFVGLGNNPLNSYSIDTCVPALEVRGVIVNWADRPCAPQVTTSDASNIGTNSATLNGELRWLGTADNVTVYFAWGTTKGGPYANETERREMTSPGAFSFDLDGLHPGVTYYYQARALGDGDAFFWGDSGFTTG